jgi:hypothetical protein
VQPNQQFYLSDPVPWFRTFRSTGVAGVRAVTPPSYLETKAKSLRLIKGSVVFSAKSRTNSARCFLNSLSNIADLNNICERLNAIQKQPAGKLNLLPLVDNLQCIRRRLISAIAGAASAVETVCAREIIRAFEAWS